jgi:transferase family protein
VTAGPVIPLSPVDHVFTGVGAYPIEFVFAYGGRLDPQRLRGSLQRTLALFPGVASRLLRLPGESYGLESAADGCVFEATSSPASFADADPRTFVDAVETVEGQPLARVRLTHTPDGSVLGVAASHAVVDGFSYFFLLSAWSRVFHGREAPPPCLDRTLLGASDARASRPLDAEAVRQGCGFFLSGERPAIPRDRLRWMRRLFPRAELSALLDEAQRDCPVRLSHNDVVAAWLWRTHVPRWAAADEPTAYLTCPVDLRRVLPGFPPTYFGCAVAMASASIERARLATASPPELARRVRDAVVRVDGERVRESLHVLDRLRREEGLAALERLHVVHPRAGLLVTNLSRLPVRDIVFDSGPPVAFDILAPVERCAVVLPAEDGLDVRICLPQGTPVCPVCT